MALGTLAVTGDPDADRLVNSDGTALLIGMLLDQQVPMEWAFKGPATLKERLGHLDAVTIAAMDPEDLVAVCVSKPAVHRFPASMGRRIHDLCTVLAAQYGGDGANVWKDVRTGEELYERLRALPGYGEEKSKIFVAILAKRLDERPEGWEQAAGPFAESTPRSVADIDGPDALARVRDWKRAQKAKGKKKTDPSGAGGS
ncbi:MAG: Fe-S cluster assembly protein HesB [Acidimicrobiia bacterium]|nr:Fe-S cluster assembly protein HesB [Acidimicrobiia bacterium]